MCGIFGFVSYDGKGPSIKRLETIAAITMQRGRHAFGFAWVDHAGRLRMFKQTGRIVDHLGYLAMAEDARFLIGHCRYATCGSPENNLNNHPHSADGGWIVHNGMIPNHEELVEDYAPVTQCDSEVLCHLIEQGAGSLRKRCIDAAQIAGEKALALLGLWNRPGRMIAIRSGNPMSIGWCQKRVYIGSLPEGLPGKVTEVFDQSGIEFTTKGMKQFGMEAKTLF